MRADQSLDRVVARALKKSRNLPSPPTVVVRVLELSKDENCRIDELTRAIGQDPALTARLMRLANSSLYGVQFKVTELQQAAVLMGMRNLRQLCLGLSLTGALAGSRPVESSGYPTELYWQHSLVASVAAREIARRVGSSLASEAFLCGLLARMGQLLLARCLPDAYRGVVDQAQVRESESEFPSPALERALLGFDQSAFGAAVMRQWQLPEPLPTAVEWASALEESEGSDDVDARDLALFTAVGELSAAVLVESNKGTALVRLRELASARLGLDATELDAFLIDIEGHVRETARLLGRAGLEGQSFAARLEAAREELLAQRGIATQALALPSARAAADDGGSLASRDRFAERLATCVRLRLEGFDHLCLGLLLIDVGVDAPDAVTRAAEVVRSNVRNSDMCARLGGSVLGLVAPATTPQALRLFGSRLEQVLGTKVTEVEGHVAIGGVCVRRFSDPADHEVLFREAHAALDSAKGEGRGVEVRYHRESLRAA